MRCRVCESDEFRSRIAHEHLNALGDEFWYLECLSCECLQLEEAPEDIDRYYNGSYPALQSSQLKTLIRTAGYRIARMDGIVGRMFGALYPGAHYGAMQALKQYGTQEDALLDVGCGVGRFLEALRILGFQGEMYGVEPFLTTCAPVPPEVTIKKCGFEEVKGRFTIITFIHVLEHIEDQIGTMKHVKELLSENGVCIISVPVVGGRIWREYSTKWVQMDPPRHMMLHSTKSMQKLAGRAGLRIVDTIWDSTAFQFWGTADVVKGRPIIPFSKAYMRNLWRMPGDTWNAYQVNKRQEGDQATFILKHSD